MSDYSLAHVPNRLAAERERLVVRHFVSGTLGLPSSNSRGSRGLPRTLKYGLAILSLLASIGRIASAQNNPCQTSQPVATLGTASAVAGTVVYDPNQGVCWLANANLAGDPAMRASLGVDGINPNGSMDFPTAQKWVAALNAYGNGSGYLGHNSWQLPVAPLVDHTCADTGTQGGSFGPQCSGSASGNLYAVGLMQAFPASVAPSFAATVGPIRNMKPSYYWALQNNGGTSGTSNGGQEIFSFANGIQGGTTINDTYYYVLPMVAGAIGAPPSCPSNGVAVVPYTSGPAAGNAVYDCNTGFTWPADANLAASDNFGITGSITISYAARAITAPEISGGAMLFQTAAQWIQAMNNSQYLGSSAWQIPASSKVLQDLFTDSQMAAGDTRLQWTGSFGPFQNLQPFFYWACQRDQTGSSQSPCTGYAPPDGSSQLQWSFNFDYGFQSTSSLVQKYFVMVYYPATVSAAADQTVYDPVNNVYWLADFNLPATNRFGLPLCGGSNNAQGICINTSGTMDYESAAAWVSAMNAAGYLGHTNWQLPTTPPLDPGCGKTGPNGNNFGFGCTASAFGSLYNNTLDLPSPQTAVPIPANTVGPFSNFQPYLYWSQTSQGAQGYSSFSFGNGFHGANTAPNFLYVLPMIPGKIPRTPEASGNGLQVNPGGQTIYDPVSQVTWLADANIAATNTFGLPPCAGPTTPALCVAADGAMTWDSANQFIANMNAMAYLGQTNWMLPPIAPTCTGYNSNCSGDPMGELFYGQFGLSAGATVISAPDIAVGPFTNIQPYLYWSCESDPAQAGCSAVPPTPNFEWSFSFGSGFEGTDLLANNLYATAYYPGPCTYSLGIGGQAFGSSGGQASIAIVTQTGCPWSVGPVPAGVTLTSPGTGVGPATVTLQVMPNAGGDISNTFTIAGQTFTVEQEGASVPGLMTIGSLAQIASEGTWNFLLDAVNLGVMQATARFNFTGDDGSPLALPLTFPQLAAIGAPELAPTLDRTINPNAQFIMESTGPANVAPLVGAGHLSANGNINGFGVFSNPANGWNAVVPLETRNASQYFLPFDNTSVPQAGGGAATPLATGVAVANLAASSANIQVTIRDDSGKIISTSVIPLLAMGHTSFMLGSPPPGFPALTNLRGTLEFDTPPGGQISVLGLRAFGGTSLTSLPVLASGDPSGGAIAHVTFNGGFTSTFYIVNTGASQTNFTLSFFDSSGNELSVPLVLPQAGINETTAALTQSLPAGAMLVVQTQANDELAGIAGSAILSTTGSVSGFEIFRWTPFNQEATVPVETRTPNSFLLVFDDTNGLTTGVALANVTGSAASVPVKIYDDTGALIGMDSIALAAQGHTSFLLPSQYSITGNKRGMVEFDVPPGGRIDALGLRAGNDGTLTTIPVLAK